MDIDGDGHPDLLSGSWPGELFLFRGTADHSFAAPEMLKDKSGRDHQHRRRDPEESGRAKASSSGAAPSGRRTGRRDVCHLPRQADREHGGKADLDHGHRLRGQCGRLGRRRRLRPDRRQHRRRRLSHPQRRYDRKPMPSAKRSSSWPRAAGATSAAGPGRASPTGTATATSTCLSAPTTAVYRCSATSVPGKRRKLATAVQLVGPGKTRYGAAGPQRAPSRHPVEDLRRRLEWRRPARSARRRSCRPEARPSRAYTRGEGRARANPQGIGADHEPPQ